MRLLAAAEVPRKAVTVEHWRPGRLCVGRWKLEASRLGLRRRGLMSITVSCSRCRETRYQESGNAVISARYRISARCHRFGL